MPKVIATDLDAVFDAAARTQAAARGGPKRGQVHGGCCEDGDLIAGSRQVAAQPREIIFRAAQRRRIALHEMSHTHVASPIGAAAPRRDPIQCYKLIAPTLSRQRRSDAAQPKGPST